MNTIKQVTLICVNQRLSECYVEYDKAHSHTYRYIPKSVSSFLKIASFDKSWEEERDDSFIEYERYV